MTPFAATILTPDSKVFDGRLTAIYAPGLDGRFGVLARHTPMIAALGPGPLRIDRESGETEHFTITGGMLEVRRDRVVVLAGRVIRGQAV
jgi:F-type H+-transporting ATPase subunit epsilon